MIIGETLTITGILFYIMILGKHCLRHDERRRVTESGSSHCRQCNLALSTGEQSNRNCNAVMHIQLSTLQGTISTVLAVYALLCSARQQSSIDAL